MGDRWAGIARMGGIGDNLIAASVLRPLKAAGYRTDVISQAPQAVVFENNPFLDRLIVKAKDDWPKDFLAWQQWFDVRGREYDLFVNLSHTVEHLAGLFPIQTAFYWPLKWRRRVCDWSYIETAHDVFDMPHTFGPLFFPTDDEQKKARATKDKIGSCVVGWCLTGTRIDKVYPYSTVAVARIIKEIGVPVILLGGPGKDYVMAQEIEKYVRAQNGSTAGLHLALSPDPEMPTWPIRRLLSQALACDVMVGPDTGPMWAVAFEPMPKVLMLSHASKKNIASHWINTTVLHADPIRVPCHPCHRLHDSPSTCVSNKENTGAACISDISVDAILQTVKAGLGR